MPPSRACGTFSGASETLELVAVVGLPVRVDGALYNCAAVVCHGALLGLVPKTHLPNYAEFYELRHFTPAPAETRSVTLCGASVPFGTDLLFRCREMPDFCLGVEICEDLWGPAAAQHPPCAGRGNGACQSLGK